MPKKKSRPLTYTVQDKVLTVLQRHTQAEAARLMGVSPRTIRRWKNENVQPCESYSKRLTHEAARERRTIERYGSAPSQNFEPPKLRVPVPAARQTRRDPSDKSGKKKIPSDTIIFDVRKLRPADIAALVTHYRKRKGSFRVILRLPPNKISKKFGAYPKGQRNVSTQWEFMEQFRNEQQVGAYLDGLRRDGIISYIVVTDKKGWGKHARKR